ncbi:MAG: hypothetical protein KAQ71_15125, partial [Desulfobulbaceae bacterium]|nr:hypothetical protein [Desulfobulbaceae bacterium]
NREPKVWFESLQSMAQILSNENQELLKVIVEQKPASIKELEEITGRKRSNLSRTLKTMARYGIVELKTQKKPSNQWSKQPASKSNSALNSLLNKITANRVTSASQTTKPRTIMSRLFSLLHLILI